VRSLASTPVRVYMSASRTCAFATLAGPWRKWAPGPGRQATSWPGGLLDFAAAPPAFVAIFGGTRDFKRARGEIEAAPVAGTAPQEWDYKVEIIL
jgi:hypothetical protein